ncbi:MAG TPA: hypothetical protein VNB90_11500 [Cytophagaceae bacterium]|jgi:hypothetical protein|nr:hypothetical protein [Cytophagaceae bacterium]
MRKKGIILFLMAITQLGIAQQKQTPQQKAASQQKSLTQPKGIDDLKKLSRKELIDRAIIHINDPEFKVANYDRIKVMANATKMYAIFDVSARYVPVLTSYYIPVYVDLVNQKVTIKEVSNSGFFSSTFYDSPKLYEKQVKWIVDNINKSGDTTFLPEKKVSDDRTLTIREVYGHFEVEVESPTQVSTCNIDKVSGKLSQISHNPLPPKKENSFVEIKQ